MRGAWLKIVVVVAVIVALGALAYRSQGSISLADFSWSRLWVEVARTRKAYLLAAVASVYLAYFLRAVRWRRFCRHMGNFSLGDVLGPTLMGFAALFVLGRAAEPVRPLLLARKN